MLGKTPGDDFRDGKITLSLLGSVVAAGKSIDSLDVEITNGLQQYYRFADVSINVVAPYPTDI